MDWKGDVVGGPNTDEYDNTDPWRVEAAWANGFGEGVAGCIGGVVARISGEYNEWEIKTCKKNKKTVTQ